MAKYLIQERGIILENPIIKLVVECGVRTINGSLKEFACVLFVENNGRETLHTLEAEPVNNIDVYNPNTWVLAQLEQIKL